MHENYPYGKMIDLRDNNGVGLEFLSAKASFYSLYVLKLQYGAKQAISRLSKLAIRLFKSSLLHWSLPAFLLICTVLCIQLSRCG